MEYYCVNNVICKFVCFVTGEDEKSEESGPADFERAIINSGKYISFY